MKKVIVLAILLIGQIAVAQVTRDLGDFDAVKVFDQLKVNLIQSSENKIIISGNRENEVEVVTKNGELKLRMPFPKLLSGNDITIKLYFKKIESIGTNEGSSVTSEETFKQTSIDLDASEGSQINVALDVKKANVRAVSGGIIDLSGNATNQNCTIATGGIYNGKELHTSQTEITVSAGGQAEIYATLLADAKVKAGGSISIYGKPKQINQKTILGGTIKEIK
jgi:hypothetical protein